MPIEPVRLDVDVDLHPVPALVFVPRSETPLPLVLLGHGAHLSKDDEVMQMLARGIARGVPAGVVLMDCPGHGERRAPGLTDEEFERDVARRMGDPAGDAALVADWQSVAAAARTRVPLLAGPLGYAGFSMGALLGLSIVADMADVRAAVFALGGVLDDGALGGRGAVRNARVRDGASRLGEREVLMLNMTRDEHFPIAGAIDVLEAIPGPKRMSVWSGTHTDIPPEAISIANQFLARTLTA
ncbi:MAG: dienelactone hydrolase family protein [Acidimicrobiia bacterium]